MSDQDRLVGAIGSAIQCWPHQPWLVLPGPRDLGLELADHIATALAGWCSPPRVIETVQELEALPVESVVQVIGRAEDPEDPVAIVWVHAMPGEWVEPGSADYHPASEVNLPVWLHWSPPTKQEARVDD